MVFTMSTLCDLILLYVSPHSVGCHKEWILVLGVILSIGKLDIASANLRSIDFLIAHSFSKESVPLFNHLVAYIRLYIPLTKSVSNFTVPCLTTNILRVDVFISDNVKIVPVSVKEVIVPLVVHSHLDQVHGWQVASSCSSNHLSIINGCHIGCSHSIDMLVVLVGDENNITGPLILFQEAANELLTLTTLVKGDNCSKVFNRFCLG
mmetsp:Transcript_20733/g.14868  ORF Transcript_20733/g.14868 Transcript_20733/m.14868 type:complete len:207 (-) Transcript_20733:965-1585(-)